jgi:F-type H+-transporting ATPase subunit delta
MTERFNEEELAVAKLYARSLLRLAQERGETGQVLEDIDNLESLLDAVPEFPFMLSPLVKPETRARVIEKSLRGHFSDLLVDTLQVMNRKGRTGMGRALIEAYRREHEKRLGRIKARVATASPLSDDQRERIRETAERVFGTRVRIVEEVDESLLGGFMIQAGDLKFDGTVKKELENFSLRLQERASAEIHAGSLHAED